MTKRMGRLFAAGILALVLAGVAGCASQLMPTPNLYAVGRADPFADVPVERRSNTVELLYVTDREPDGANGKQPHYGYGRSSSMAFGTVDVRFGRNISWPELVAASRSQIRLLNLAISVGGVKELGRFPPWPPMWRHEPGGGFVETAESADQRRAAEQALKDAIRQRLAVGTCKDVYLYLHGFDNTFEESVQVMAQVWHFLGRRGVPIAYSWPAGRGGLRGYPYDRESSEFTVLHLKRLLQLLGECPEVGRVHVLAHSRGTDAAVTALRELHLEYTAAGRPTGEALKLGTLVLASPDIDLDLALQKLSDQQLFRVPELTVVYVSRGDLALKLANWLFLGMTRLGRVRPRDLPQEALTVLRDSGTVQVVDTYDVSTGFLGHDDFFWSPAVSSDLMLVLRDHRKPGAENGRPLGVEAAGFWCIGTDYPRNDR